MLTLQALNECFEFAVDSNAKYIAVRINVGLTKAETIINERENFAEKKDYYNHAYNEGLRHKFAGDQDIRIVGFTYGDTFSELESLLEACEITGALN